jgi:hypothetical protein
METKWKYLLAILVILSLATWACSLEASEPTAQLPETPEPTRPTETGQSLAPPPEPTEVPEIDPTTAPQTGVPLFDPDITITELNSEIRTISIDFFGEGVGILLCPLPNKLELIFDSGNTVLFANSSVIWEKTDSSYSYEIPETQESGVLEAGDMLTANGEVVIYFVVCERDGETKLYVLWGPGGPPENQG